MHQDWLTIPRLEPESLCFIKQCSFTTECQEKLSIVVHQHKQTYQEVEVAYTGSQRQVLAPKLNVSEFRRNF